MTAVGPGSQFLRSQLQGLAASPAGKMMTRLDHIDLLLRQIQEATLTVRRLLNAAGSNGSVGSGGPLLAGTESIMPPPPVILFRQGDPANDGIDRAEVDAINWNVVTRGLIRERFESVGHVGAGVLLRLLCTPGEFVTGEELAQAAGVRSASNRVIKVYVCRLRQAVIREGMQGTIIETGRRSYRLRAEASPQIMASLMGARVLALD